MESPSEVVGLDDIMTPFWNVSVVRLRFVVGARVETAVEVGARWPWIVSRDEG